MNKILENIEAIRKERGITQEYIANRLGVSQQAYSGYFTETGDMKISRILDIADIMGVSLIDIVTYPVKYKPIDEDGECVACKEKDATIRSLNEYIDILKFNTLNNSK